MQLLFHINIFCMASLYFICIIRIRLKGNQYSIKSKKIQFPAGLDSKIRFLYAKEMTE